MADLSDLITRKYSNFRGVDFSNSEVNYYRSPDSKNMWKNYEDGSIETRPGMKLLDTFDNRIYGLFFLNKDDVLHILIHAGTKLLKWTNYPNTPAETTELYTGMNVRESNSFVFDEILFIKDGINYLEYDGTNVKKVEGTIPVTSYWKNPDGSTSIDTDTDTDLVYQAVNCLTNLRKNQFIADGTSKDYQLDSTNIDSTGTYLMQASVNGVNKVENIDFTVNHEKGIVTFKEAPAKDVEVIITYSKTTNGYKERILNCTLMCEFDNRFFFAGNPNYPNAVFHCELNDPRYVRDTAYYECGIDEALVKAIIPGNGVLWILKEINQNSSSVYYMTPTLDSKYDKIYPSQNGSISLGCVSTGINFNDDIVFFSNRGLEGISSSSMYSEQILQHRSSLVDGRMLAESDYKNVKIAEYNGFLMCLIGSHIYLADSRQKFQNSTNDIEYEWYYWEFHNNINFIKEYRGNLYLGNTTGQLFVLEGTTDNGTNIESYWTTYKDDFGYPSYTKTTNKRGNVVDLKIMNNKNIKVDTIVDGVLKEKTIVSDSKGYAPYRIKDKKFKEIQLKFSSDKPFGLFSATLQGFVAGYIKR